MDRNYKRVVFVIGSLRYSGAERVLLCIANYLAAKGRDVGILLLQPESGGTYNDRLNSRIRCQEAVVCGNVLTSKIRRLLKIRTQIKKMAPDIIISFGNVCNTNTLAAMLFSRIPVIVSERNDPRVDPPKIFKRMVRCLTYPFASGFVFQTNEARKYFPMLIQKRSTVIPNPVAAESVPSVFEGDRKKDIVSVGRLDLKQKNHSLLIRAFAYIANEFPNYRLVIYGEGPDRKQLEAEAAATGLGGRIQLPGSEPNVPMLIRNAALFVLPSNFEGMPNALIEAMAVGLPVISTDCPCGGPRYLIRHGVNGMLTPVGDEQKMAEVMRSVLLNTRQADAMGMKAREVLRTLDREVISAKWDEYIEKIYKKSIIGW